MKFRLATSLLLVVGLAVAAVSLSTTTTTTPAKAADTGTWPIDTYGTPRASDNAILKWDEQLLSTIRAYPPQTGPTITSRALGVLHTATYDAWAAYDPTAKVTRPDGPAQQKSTLNTLDNKTKAISYAAYRTLLDLFPPAAYPNKGNYKTPDVLLSSQGYDPSSAVVASPTATNADPRAVGNLAAQAVTNYRHNDGSNQLNGYADASYTPKNQWNNIIDRWRWAPLCVLTAAGAAAGDPIVRDPSQPCPDPAGHYTVQKATTPQWGRVTMFSSLPASSYRVSGPLKNPDGSFSTSDIPLSLSDTSNLTDQQKAVAEYWADGPNSEFPPGHTALFAQAISRKNSNSLDTDVKLFFQVGNAEMDAGIACWYQKFKWDYVRPITAIREQYKGGQITSWRGPNQGYGLVDAANWIPYQAPTVLSPPFPEYPSGHSTFTSAGAQMLAMANGDTFGASVTIQPHTSKFESNTPAAPVTMSWATFTDAATEAGLSRRWGGIHFQTGDFHGRALGKQVAANVYSVAQSYIRGYTGK
ncbi:MAG TPA: phosphoesterase [Actinomycetota bacterium]|nr:phosphoesterase [Actinomycetota bacterium]